MDETNLLRKYVSINRSLTQMDTNVTKTGKTSSLLKLSNNGDITAEAGKHFQTLMRLNISTHETLNSVLSEEGLDIR